jgi:hypothetical protein
LDVFESLEDKESKLLDLELLLKSKRIDHESSKVRKGLEVELGDCKSEFQECWESKEILGRENMGFLKRVKELESQVGKCKSDFEEL